VVTCPNCGEENPAKFRLCGYCGTPLAAALPPQEVRKTVTIVFSDLKGSTSLGEALDSEALREVMSRYFDTMSVEIERHGGLIEKFIGDAIMAVFGLPTLHEDDALRAVKAAAGMQRALAALNADLEKRYGVTLANRTGVNTGEVVAGDPATGQRLVTGDPVNTAARLEQAAPTNEILIGELTYGLVRDAVRVEPVEPLELKGKAERVPAYRLLAVQDVIEGRARRADAPIVGRETELQTLRLAFAEAVVESGPRMATVIGDAGVGKSRLIREFTETVPEAVVVLRGRCLPYGEGITFWPIVEIAREAAGIREEDAPDVARSKLLALVDDREVAVRVASAAGLTPAQFPLSELLWGVRRLFEIVGARRPLVAVIDDIHWAEPALLDLVDHILDNLEAAPVMLLCSARHDLLEARPDWGQRDRGQRVVLEPLSDADSSRIVENLLGSARLPAVVRDRIIAAAEGNPLYVEQMLSMLIDSGALRHAEGGWIAADETVIAVPPSIQALLAARLDRLRPEERAVVEPAAVIGLTFAAAAVTDLAPEAVRPAVPEHLAALDRRQLVAPLEASSGRDDSHRFRHLLIRDAAYGGLLKRARATLHERYVAWADRVNADRQRELEYQEILGYHLEQAYRYRSELGPLDEDGIQVGRDGAGRLAAAARRAYTRGDMHAAANLYGRATELLPAQDDARLALLPDLGETLVELGEFADAEEVLSAVVVAADERFDDRLRARAALIRLLSKMYAGDDEAWSEHVTEETENAARVFEQDDDHAGLARTWRLRFASLQAACRYGEAHEAAGHFVAEAALAGDQQLEARGAVGLALASLLGPAPVRAAIDRCEELLGRVETDRRTYGLILCFIAQLRAMAGELDAARSTYRQAREMLESLGHSVLSVSTSINSWRVEMLAGDRPAAEAELRRDLAALEAMGERYLLSTIVGALGQVLWADGRIEEAEAASERAEELTSPDDIESQALWRSVRAKALAARGDRAALGIATAAVELIRPAQAPALLAETLEDLAETQMLLGQRDDGAGSLREALDLYAAKGDVVSAARVRARTAAMADQISTPSA
jgi:class 3 adenylate cyclase/tetratricopeptide (TPR) repeat protein